MIGQLALDYGRFIDFSNCFLVFHIIVYLMLKSQEWLWYVVNVMILQPISRLIKTMVVLLFLGHIDGCLFWFMESNLNAPRWIDKERLTDTVFSTQYLVSYISALKSLVLKLRSAYKDEENIYVIFEFIAGILAYGTVFGNIHSKHLIK